MATTLSPKTNNWTKWHQQRLVNSGMERDLSNAPNQKYINIVKEIVG